MAARRKYQHERRTQAILDGQGKVAAQSLLSPAGLGFGPSLVSKRSSGSRTGRDRSRTGRRHDRMVTRRLVACHAARGSKGPR
jgi:hypothetical protein